MSGGKIYLEVKACDDDVITQIAKKVIELTGVTTIIQESIELAKVENTLTVQEVADKINKEPATVTKYLRSGIIVGTKPGKSWIIKKSDLENYINGK